MSEYPKKEILGFNIGDFDELICMNCVREGSDNGVTHLREDIILFKKDMDENKIYFCDHCYNEILPDDNEIQKVEAEAKT